jgi:hypothetical protein
MKKLNSNKINWLGKPALIKNRWSKIKLCKSEIQSCRNLRIRGKPI